MPLVYNRIAKSGSTFLYSVLALLQKRNHFHLDARADHHPSAEVLAQHLTRLGPDVAYVNHAGFIDATPPEIVWINVLRDPIARWSSLYYYEVDASLRGGMATQALAKRAHNATCGCAKLEFHACIRLRWQHHCPLTVPSQIAAFCAPGENATCGRATAFKRVQTRYRLVGLVEEMDTTLSLFEALIPRFFAGAHNVSMRAGRRETSLTNQLTKTTLNGAIPDDTRRIIAQHADNYHDERGFYEDVKRLFWKRACIL